MPNRFVEKSISIGRHYGECQVRADTFNQEDRTVEIIWTTGAAVKRYSYDEGYFLEELDISEKAIRMDRFDSMSLLDAHSNRSMADRLGTVVKGSVRIENGKAYCTIRLNSSEGGEQIFRDLADGHPLPISVGYKIHKYEKTEASGNKLPVLRAIDWEPVEISAVPVPADAGAHSRDAEGSKTDSVLVRQVATQTAAAVSTQELIMDKRKAAKTLKDAELSGFAVGHGVSRNENESDADLSKRLLALFDQQDKDAVDAEAKRQADEEAEAARAAEEDNSQRNEPSSQNNSDTNDALTEERAAEIALKASKAAAADERKRAAEISQIAEDAGYARNDFVQTALRDGTSVAQFRNILLEKMIEGEERTPTDGVTTPFRGQDEVETRREAMANALLHRSDPQSVELIESAREWRGMGLIEMAREYLRQSGDLEPGMNVSRIAERALHGTSDFPIILGDVVRTRLLAAYQAFPNTFRMIARRNTVTNFKEVRAARLGENPELLKVNEHGEFPRGSMVEGSESYKIATYGRVISMTRQMLINDDLNAFAKVPSQWGRQVAKLEGDIIWGFITANAKMSSDGKALFHADHKNLDGTGRAIDVAGLKAARMHFRKQTDIDKQRIDLAPKFLFVSTDDEVDAQQLLASIINPTTTAEVVPEAIRSLTPVSEYRLDADAGPIPWYLFADPADLDSGLEYAYLAGNEEPFVDERIGFDVDGVEYKVRHDFGGGLTDWRFGYKNPGV